MRNNDLIFKEIPIWYSKKSWSDIQRNAEDKSEVLTMGQRSRPKAADNGCNKTPIKSPPTTLTSITHSSQAKNYSSLCCLFCFRRVEVHIKAGRHVIWSFITGLLINQRAASALMLINFSGLSYESLINTILCHWSSHYQASLQVRSVDWMASWRG